MIETLLLDLRYGMRMLFKVPGFSLIAIITLALGIGANTAIFSVIDGVLLKPLPYPNPDRLVRLDETGEVTNRPVSYLNFKDWRERNDVFDSISTFREWDTTLTGSGAPEVLRAEMVAADYFKVLQARTLFGRGFTLDDEKTSAQVTVFSYGFWQKNFGADPNVIGKTITLDSQPFQVIGVIQREFRVQGNPRLWVLVGGKWSEAGADWSYRDTRTAGYVIGRLKPGVTLPQARANMDSVETQLVQQYPMADAGHRIEVISLQESITGKSRSGLLILFGAVGLVLLIACANVANLLLSRGAGRQREFAVRTALGAGRARLMRQLLTESLMLALVGGAAGLMLAWWTITLLSSVQSQTLPRAETLGLDWRILGFNLSLSALTGLIFGLAPAWQISKTSLAEALKDGARSLTAARGSGLRGALVVAEVALSLMLLVGAGLLVNSLVRLFRSNAGFDPINLVTMEIALPSKVYAGAAKRNQFQRQLLERVSVLPGVERAAISNNLPGLADSWQTDIFPEGHKPINPGELINVDWSIVSEDYFSVMRIPILQGRSFTTMEAREGLPVVLVDEMLARKFWPNQSALGKHIKYDSRIWHEIIGVVKEVKEFGSEAEPRIKIYTPIGHSPQPRSVLSLRTAHADQAGIIASVTREIQQLDKDLPISNVATMDQLLKRETASKRFNTILFSVFAALALILAAVGIYGVMSYAVAQRTHEIGVRMALGAQTRNVLGLIVGQGMKQIGLGVLLGLGGAIGLSRVISTLLYGVTATDPLTYGGVVLLLMAVALLACFIPARRATRVDPIEALRYE